MCLMQTGEHRQDHNAVVSDKEPLQAELQVPEPIPIPDQSPHLKKRTILQIIAEICHDYFFLILLGLVLLEVFVLPISGLSLVVRIVIAFSLCSLLIAVAQGVGSLFFYWLAIGIMLLLFYGDVLIEIRTADGR
jgi:hypothetical protein